MTAFDPRTADPTQLDPFRDGFTTRSDGSHHAAPAPSAFTRERSIVSEAVFGVTVPAIQPPPAQAAPAIVPAHEARRRELSVLFRGADLRAVRSIEMLLSLDLGELTTQRSTLPLDTLERAAKMLAEKLSAVPGGIQ